MRISLGFVLLLALLGPVYSSDEIAWGAATDGMVVGVSSPKIDQKRGILHLVGVYLVNRGTEDVGGVIQSPSRCVIKLNGQLYGRADYGGKSSWMPPEKMYGPIEIDPMTFGRLKRQLPARTVSDDEVISDDRPVLRPGENQLCILYFFGGSDEKVAESGMIEIEG